MPRTREIERYNVRKYFLDMAGTYEKNGFLLAAAAIYRKYNPEKARRIYKYLAEKAEQNKFHLIAAEMYGAAGKRRKARSLRGMFGSEPELRMIQALSRTYDEKPLPKTYGPVNKFLFATTKYEREGNFEKALKYWLKAAQYYERVGEFRLAALYYFRTGDLRNAKRLWKKAG